MSKKEHMYAQAIRLFADGEEVQTRHMAWPENDWVCAVKALGHLLRSEPGWTFRIKPEPPKTVIINGVECPAPLREAPKLGQRYWTERIEREDLAIAEWWEGLECEREWLAKGIIHRTEEAARKSCMARHFLFPEQQSKGETE